MSGIFKPLGADDIECRVAQINKDNSVNLLLYKNARTDAKYLDEVIGQWNWQCDFKEVAGVVYCGIGIKFENEWIWKWDAGSAGNIEAEKSTASDAFKRAAFKFGLGRELYDSPRIRVKADKAGVQDGKCYTPFKVSEVEYDEEGNMVKLIISHAWNDDILFQWYASQPNNAPDKFVAPSANDKADKATVQKIITAYVGKDESLMKLMEMYHLSDIRDLTVSQAETILRGLRKKGVKV